MTVRFSERGATGPAGPPGDASKLYVQSRGLNLITNGTGLMGTNENFSSFTFMGSEVAVGGGSFRHQGVQVGVQSDEFIPVDTSEMYRLVGWGKTSPGTTRNHYLGVVEYDIDKASVNAYQTNISNGGLAKSYLAADLVPGATYAEIVSVANFIVPVLNNSDFFGVFGYANSFGYVYPDYTYTRRVGSSAGRVTPGAGGVDYVLNRVNFNTPWPATWGTLPAGLACAQFQAGGTYKYITAIGAVIPSVWTKYTGHIGRPEAGNIYSTNRFRPGTAFIRLLFLVNYPGGTNVAGDLFWSGLNFELHPRAIQSPDGVWWEHKISNAGADSYVVFPS